MCVYFFFFPEKPMCVSIIDICQLIYRSTFVHVSVELETDEVISTQASSNRTVLIFDIGTRDVSLPFKVLSLPFKVVTSSNRTREE
ncbi:hypothetical protein BRADI_5g11305v3 [Brachypodium distachyon]|uniref:Uncharacterized protein n=1 Tax=Brachypodium distachyon TaxID=15368 RepID=A0A2K2CGM9_BRADI|nr:hypothetical protein BRADI_5g11305v3 [Brachypodium distachyon]